MDGLLVPHISQKSMDGLLCAVYRDVLCTCIEVHGWTSMCRIQDVLSTFLEVHGWTSMCHIQDVLSTCIEVHGWTSMCPSQHPEL